MNDMEIAKEIQKQLGSRCLYMINARNLTVVEGGLSMKIMGRKFNYVIIKLNSLDYYDMHFEKWHGGKKVRGIIKQNVSVEDIRITISEVTGLATTLGTIEKKGEEVNNG